MSDLDSQIEILVDAAEQLTEARAGRNPEEDRKLAQTGIDALNDLFDSVLHSTDTDGTERFAWSKQAAVAYAAWEFAMYGNAEPFEKAIQVGNPYLLQSDRVKNMLAALVRGERPSKHLLRKRDSDLRGAEIMRYLLLLKSDNIPICGESKTDQETAIQKASKKFNISPETIRKHIWETRKK